MDDATLDEIAGDLLYAAATANAAAPRPHLGIDDGYAVAARIRALREARGESPVGRKIGFTNTTILHRYGISHPMWGTVYDSTLSRIGQARVDPSAFHEPRIEPEIVLRIGRTPCSGMTEAELLDCVEAVALGFEIVQSVFVDWRFSPAEAIAAQGLHGALHVGPWHDISPERAVWGRALTEFGVTLLRNGAPIDRGHARNVLGGPLRALGFLIQELAARSHPGLTRGEVVTTGTLTDAWPIGASEQWLARVEGLPLADIRLATEGHP